jgi:uncharacterized circularly permuted ATP-grasp superfamily protein
VEGWQDLPNRLDRLRHRVREDGATYNVYDDPDQPTRPWPLELLPMLIGADDWVAIEQGVPSGRACSMPPWPTSTASAACWTRACCRPRWCWAIRSTCARCTGPSPWAVCTCTWRPSTCRAARTAAGGCCSSTQAPSGLGYLIENRLIVSQQLPEAFRDLHVQRLAASFQTLMEGLMRISPAGETSRAVLLTPGPRNETYFEHVFLARYLGITLVEGGDLTVRANRLYLKTLRGLERVHILLRRVDDEYLDPLELRPDSALGIPGLVQALRAGEVVVANAPGAGWLESPGLAAFWPGVSRHLLGEELLLPSATSWWCGEQTVWDTHKGRLEEFVVAPTFPASDTTHSFAPVLAATQAPSARASLAGRIEADPAAHTLQSRSRPRRCRCGTRAGWSRARRWSAFSPFPTGRAAGRCCPAA